MRTATDPALVFAERLLELVNSARLSTTYKLATLMALFDVAAERTDASGGPPTTLPGREVARRVIDLYWPQTVPYDAVEGASRVLRHSSQNDIPAKLADWRASHGVRAGATMERARMADPGSWDELMAGLEATVLAMPLAKLQRFGGGQSAREDRFIYDFSWREEIKRRQTEAEGFDDTLYLHDQAGEWLVRFAPLVRPLVEARFVERVAQQNREMLDQPELAEFLFGADRISLVRVSGPLAEMQERRCFYCGDGLRGAVQVDHFVPWSRRHHNDLDNLVAAHGRCNGAKSASLAATGHLERWLARFDPGSADAAGVDHVQQRDTVAPQPSSDSRSGTGELPAAPAGDAAVGARAGLRASGQRPFTRTAGQRRLKRAAGAIQVTAAFDSRGGSASPTPTAASGQDGLHGANAGPGWPASSSGSPCPDASGGPSWAGVDLSDHLQDAGRWKCGGPGSVRGLRLDHHREACDAQHPVPAVRYHVSAHPGYEGAGRQDHGSVLDHARTTRAQEGTAAPEMPWLRLQRDETDRHGWLVPGSVRWEATPLLGRLRMDETHAEVESCGPPWVIRPPGVLVPRQRPQASEVEYPGMATCTSGVGCAHNLKTLKTQAGPWPSEGR